MDAPAKRILVVDDDPDTCTLVSDILNDDGYGIIACLGGEQAWIYLEQERFDLVLADIKMPGLTGTALLQRMRDRGMATPVVLMTAYPSLETAIDGLRGSAVDYIQKPFSTKELRERVRHTLRAGNLVPDVVRYLDLEVDLVLRRAWLNGNEIKLTRRQMDILIYLARNRERTASWQELLRECWGFTEPTQEQVGPLRICILRLRKKLGDDPRNPRYIINKWGEGYRLGA